MMRVGARDEGGFKSQGLPVSFLILGDECLLMATVLVLEWNF
jgi:hypothetical protein